jgi:L-aspartate oxidase
MIGRDPAPLATEALRGEGAILVNERRTLHARAIRTRARAARHRRPRGVFAEIAAGRGAFLDARKRSAANSPTNSRPSYASLPRGRHRSRAPADPDRARGALPHGRRRTWTSTAAPRSTGSGRRRGRLDRRARREPPRLELAARGGGVRRPHRRGHRAFAQIEADTKSSALRNMATAALLIAASAYSRMESRGGHFRSDFPKTDPARAARSFMTLADARKIAQRANTKAA